MINCEFENGSKASLRHIVVDNLVLKNDKILLVKRANGLPEGGKWGLVGGFVERNETLEEAVKREIFEETGYTVDSTTLLRINDNPNRPREDRQNISFVYFCFAGEKNGVADKESDSQEWFPLSALPPEDEFAFDGRSNIELYKKYLSAPFSLPQFG